ncbi:hypothetical protein EAI_03092 [Harpegnathos saltator]|uniref:Uncharacterized protein n=2 Tax=Harpegnathos saltator TaxID=610380 RepID=E2BK63_HARSA|nr:hypothetical protein EAI_03092 [Harpegnathos saltator]
MPMSGVATNKTNRQAKSDELKAETLTIVDEDGRRETSHVGVGEWNSLPILIERLREALELSLAAGCWCSDESTPTSSLTESNAGVEVNDQLHTCCSMGQAVLVCNDDNPKSKKNELKFLEDLLLTDIQMALSRLRGTLECTDVATLAKHGGVSDPTSKLYLLRLVSSLLSRLQVPQKEAMTADENKLIDIAIAQVGTSTMYKRRPIRHTIGVSTEEIAYARKQLEENSANLVWLNKISASRPRETLYVSASNNVSSNAPNSMSNDMLNTEKHIEEICDKCTKDAINQRQSLRDKNKEFRGGIGSYQPITFEIGESNTLPDRHCSSTDSEEITIKRTNEEQSRVSKLAAVLRQRAEQVSASNVINNKFATKKSKIKRANTVDIPSYLKLQAGSFGCDNSGCVQLRRPINVGDKVASNTIKNVTMPSFHPRTENDKKFLALINRNTEVQTTPNAAPAFKSFSYTKTTGTLSVANENWNSRFSNIKTAFNKPISVNDENKISPKSCPAKCFPNALQTPSWLTNIRTLDDSIGNSSNGLSFINTNASKPNMGFRHAPSSLFQKIDKSHSPILSPNYHCVKGSTLSIGKTYTTVVPTLHEKARIMCDRNSNVQSQSTTFKIYANENSQKPFFSRPPWMEHDRNEKKPKKMLAENGRLDYRFFCKQFAPFINKNTVTKPKISQNVEEQYKRNEHSIQREVFLPSDEKMTTTDEKVTFEMSAKKESRIQQHHKSNYSCHKIEEPVRDKFDLRSEKDVSESMRNRQYSEQDLLGNIVDVTHNNSSTIETSENNNNQSKEMHVFQVVSRVLKNFSPACNDTSVQIYNQPEQPVTDYVESKKEWMTPHYKCNETNSMLNSNFHPAKDPRNFVLDYNCNYHTVATKNENSISEHPCDLIEKQSSVHILNPSEIMPYQNISDYHASEQHEQVFQTDNFPYGNNLSSMLATNNQSQIYPNYPLDVKSNGNLFESEISNVPQEIDKQDHSVSCINNGSPSEEQRIQNQDISVDARVVTRYTCAIGTVASADTSEIRLDEMRPEFRVPSSSSTSHFRPYARETSNEITTTEKEIHRHNILQQNLVRRLQNERTMLNNQYAHVSKQSSSFNQSSKFQSSDTPKLELPLISNLLSIPSISKSGFGANRVTVLKKQYEQPSNQLKPIQKERSPVLNDVNGVMDSSDKYLVSCCNKSAKSVVLSKSESWHQLALSNSHHPLPHSMQGGLPPMSSYLPKLRKPKSPSFFRTKKQYEASLSSDSVKRMEDKIRRYFDNSNDNTDAKNPKKKDFSSHDVTRKSLVGLSRSRTMPGIYHEKLHLLIPTESHIPATNLNSADVDKVFDDIFEEATRTDDHRF